MTAITTRFWNRLFRRRDRQARPSVRRLPFRFEPLEARDVPATLFGLTESNTLLRFDSLTPNTAFPITLSGLAVGENIVGIDYRPADEKLYGFSNKSSKVYTINTTSGAVTLVGDPMVNSLATSFGFDFNPTVDRIRVTGNDGANFRLNPNNGTLVMIDGALNGGSTNLTGVAYTNNFAGATTTTLFGIDGTTDKLFSFTNPNTGANVEVGALTFDTDERVGFDIAYDDGIAYAGLTVAGEGGLYIIDLASGKATFVNKIGAGAMGTPLIGLAAAPLTNNPPVVLFTGGTGKYDIQTDVAVQIDTGATIADPDSLNFNGGSLTVTENGGNAVDKLSIQNQGTGAGQVGVSGVSVTFGGVTIGTFTGGGFGVPLVVTFTSDSATVAAAQAVLRAVTFETADNVDLANRLFSAKVVDGDGLPMDTGTTPTDAKVVVGDFTPPTVTSIKRLDPNPTQAAALNFQAIFSEDVDSTKVDVTDFKLSGTFPNTRTIISVTKVDNKTYNVLVNIDAAGEGTVGLDLVDDDSIVDLAGNPLNGVGTGNTTTGEAYTIDRTGPIVILMQAPGQTDPAIGEPVVFFVSFGEDVTDFTASDIMLSGTAGATTVKIVPLTPGNNNFNVEVTGATQDGTVIINFGPGVAFDAAGNGNQAIDPFLFDNKVTLNVVNDAPTVDAKDVTAVEETAFTFDATNPITVADSDLNGQPIQVTLTASDGTLALGSKTGLTTIDDDGTDGTLSFKGLLADVNAALLTLTFTGNLDFDGVATLKIDADDLGSTGSGGPQVGSATVNITVDGVNDAPTITINTGTGLTTDEDVALAVPAGTVVIADVDAGTNDVKVTLTGANGTLTLGTIAGLTFSTGDGTDDGTMTFTGKLTDVNAAIDTLTFTPTLDFVGTGSVLIDVDDQGNTGTGGPLTDADSFDITITDVNDAPVITAPAKVSATEDTKFSFTGTDSISIADSDILAADELLVTLTSNNGKLTLGDLTGLTFTAGDGTDDDSMTFKGTLAAVNAALLTLSYNPAADFNGAALVTIVANDQGSSGTGGAQETTANTDVDVAAVNDAPTVTIDTSKGAQSTDEDTIFDFPDGTIVIADIDAGSDTVQVTVTSDKGTLTFTDFSKLTFTVGDGTEDATMTFTGTIADINAALDGLKVNPPADFNGAAVVSVTVNDKGHNGTGGDATATGNTTVTFNAVNDAPVVTVPATKTTAEDTTLTLSGADAISIADVDVGSSQMKVTITSTNGTVTLDGVTGLTFTTGDGTADVSMVFTGTLVDINNALDGLKFNPNANFTGDGKIEVKANDQGNTGTGGALEDTETLTITVTGGNDAPIAGNDAFTTKQNTALNVSAPGLLGNDSDPEGTVLTVVNVSAVPASQGTLVSVGNGAFTFTPAPNFSGTVTFTYQASDGLLTSNTATVTITVTAEFTRLYATGADAGGSPHVLVYNSDNSLRFSFLAFDENFNGGVEVSTGDVNGDGIEDIITAAGAGGNSQVRVFSGANLAQIHNFFAYQNFSGNVHIAAGDINGDGFADVITGAGEGGGPHVKAFDGRTGAVLQQFFAYNAAFLGGVNVAAFDYSGDNKADIVTGAGPGGAPHVAIYAGLTSRILSSFLAFDEKFSGGVQVSAGELNNEAVVFCAAGSGGVPVVTVINAKTGTQTAAFFAFEQDYSGGVRIGSEIQLDGTTTLFVARGAGDLPTVRVLEANTLLDQTAFNAYAPEFLGGVFVG